MEKEKKAKNDNLLHLDWDQMLLINNKYLHENFSTENEQLQCFKQNLKIIQPWNTYLAHFWDTTKVGDINQQYIKNKSLWSIKEFNQSMELIDKSAKPKF